MSTESAIKPAADLNPQPRVRRFPTKMILMTIAAVGLMVVSKIFESEVVDSIGLSPDFANVFRLLITFALFAAWAIWIVFFSGIGLLTRIFIGILAALTPYLAIKTLRPVNDGDMNFVRFNPIWQAPRVLESNVETSEGLVDLKTETPLDFPQFLGKNRNAVTNYQGPFADNAIDDAEVVWKKEIGEGWSSFAIRNGNAITMEQRGDEEWTSCYALATGEIQWVYKHTARQRDPMNIGRVGPRSTPTIDNGFVYSMGAMGNFVCLDGSNGNVVWQKNILDIIGVEVLTGVDPDGIGYQYENSTLAWGRSCSPLIVDDMVVVTGGGPRDGERITLIAFDKNTGEQKWTAGDEMIAYGSPSLATLCGVKQILLVAETKVIGFQADTGEQLWEIDRAGSSEGAANCSQVSFISDNQVLLSKGYSTGGLLLNLESQDGKFTTETVEVNPRVLKTKLTSPVIKDGYAYSLSDGFLECTEVKTLRRVWKKRGRFGHGQLLLGGDNLLVHSEFGELSLVKATPEKYIEVSKMSTIEGVCWNTIARSGDLILVRSELEAECIRLGNATE